MLVQRLQVSERLLLHRVVHRVVSQWRSAQRWTLAVALRRAKSAPSPFVRRSESTHRRVQRRHVGLLVEVHQIRLLLRVHQQLSSLLSDLALHFGKLHAKLLGHFFELLFEHGAAHFVLQYLGMVSLHLILSADVLLW